MDTDSHLLFQKWSKLEQNKCPKGRMHWWQKNKTRSDTLRQNPWDHFPNFLCECTPCPKSVEVWVSYTQKHLCDPTVITIMCCLSQQTAVSNHGRMQGLVDLPNCVLRWYTHPNLVTISVLTNVPARVLWAYTSVTNSTSYGQPQILSGFIKTVLCLLLDIRLANFVVRTGSFVQNWYSSAHIWNIT